jgi:phosphoenolpyruvate---glycerone phosphotransferase subunit DhaL
VSAAVTVTVEGLAAWVRGFAAAVHEHRDELTRLDAAIGDADHGSNMDRGMTAVVAALDAATPATADELFKQVGMTLVKTVGGASGPLYGTLFLRMGTAAGAESELDGAGFGAALRAGLDGVLARGKAERGDKTMVDALGPAVDAYESTLDGPGGTLGSALAAACAAATAGRDATVPLLARKGRASYLGERSVGHQDPGATSTALLLAAAVAALG